MKQFTIFNQLTAMPKRLAMVLTVLFTLGVGSVLGAEVFNITSYSNSPSGWTNSKVGTGSYFNFNTNGCYLITSTYGPHTNLTLTYKVATYGSGTNHPLTIQLLDENGTVKQTHTTGTPTSSSYITGTWSIGDVNYKFKIKFYLQTAGKGVRLQSPKLVGTEAATCDKKVTLTKGSETNGTFTLDKANGSYDNCDENFVVKVSNITPKSASQYCSGINVTGGNSSVTGPVDGVWTVTYTKENNITSTITPIFANKASASINFENMGSPAPTTTGYYVGDTYILPSENDFTCGDKTFVGWSAVPIDNSANKPTTNFYEPGTEVTLGANNTFYAVFAESGGTGSTSWEKTDISGISSSDVVVITSKNSSSAYYAMTNNNGTGSAPAATSVTVSNNKLSSTPNDNLKWNISNNSGTLTIYPNGTTSTLLYCTSTNNGVRVGTNAAKAFTIDATSGYLKHTGTSRYIGVYNNADWRCYTTVNDNIKNQTLEFYKKTTTGGYQNYTTECGSQTDCSSLTFANNIAANHTATYTQNAPATELTVVASLLGATYQWYSNTTNSTTSGTAIDGATNSRFQPLTSVIGTTYYYCVATYDKCTITSNVATIVVKAQIYTITIDNNIQDGTVEADKASAEEGETVKLTITPTSEYKLKTITVTKNGGGTVEVQNNQFTMPASNVTVSATFVAIPKLDTPANLEVTNITCTGATLSWNNVENNNGYTLSIKNTSSTQTFKSEIDKDVTSGSPTLNPGTTYTWNVIAKGDGTNYTNSEVADGGSFTTNYKITYNVKSGTWTACADGCVAGGEDFAICSTVPTKDGCNFVGWSTADDTEAEYQAGETINNVSANTTLYAVWEQKKYTVNWYVNGTSKREQTDVEGAALTDIPEPTTSDCDNSKVFVGWTTKADYSHATDAPDGMITNTTGMTMPEGGEDYYAVFATSSGGSGSVDYSSTHTSNVPINDGTAITNTNVIIESKEYAATKAGTGSASGSVVVTIPAGTTQLSFHMAGWNGEGGKTITLTGATADPSSFKTIADAGVSGNGKYTLLGDVAQYAYSTTLTNITQETKITFANNGADQRFVIWGVNASTGVSYSDYTTTCDATKATVTYDLNGGTGATCEQTTVTKDEAFNLCSSTPTKNGYTFAGWSDGTKTYAAGAEVTISESTTFYASWKAKTITITWNLNYTGCPEAETSTYVYEGDEIEMPEDPIRTGYKFNGWYTESTDGTEVTEVGDENKPSADVTYYAQWEKLHTVTFIASGQVYVKQEHKYISGDKLVLPETDPSAANFACDGYLFEGWSKYQQTKEDANRPELVDANTLVENDLELHAVWKKASASGGATTIFYESFDTENGKGANDDDWSNSVGTNDLVNETWTFENGHGAYQCVKLGSSKNKGSATTPTLTQLSGDAKLSFKAAAWVNNNETTTLNLSISGGGTLTPTSVTMVKGAWTTYEVQITGGTSSSKITFEAAIASNNRFFLDEVKITTSGSYNYTTVPNCGPTMVARENVWVTSANGQSVKVNVPLGIKLFEGNATITGTSTNENFVVNTLENAGNGEHQVVVVYTPTLDDTKENTTITLTAKNGEDTWATTTFVLNGRSLPDEFVIVAQYGDKWLALPANMQSGADQYNGIEVTPNNALTQIPAAPSTTIYSLRGVADNRYEAAGTCVRLVGNGNKCLWGNAAKTNTTIQNWTTLASTNGSNYEWLLTTSDGELYTIANPAHPDYNEGRILSNSGSKYGLYKGTTKFYILPVGCSSQPGNIQVTARRVDATFSWEGNASSMRIDVYTNDAMTEVNISNTPTASPYYMTGLSESTQYWFKMTPNGTDHTCAYTGTFKTTGPTIDVVEWKENAAVIFVDKDENLNPLVIIDGEVEHGQGSTLATDLFFSKYFEAQGTAKLLAIYNGTANAISLADITILHRSKSDNSPLSLAAFGKTKGWIQPGEEVIVYNVDDRNAIMDCAKQDSTFKYWNNVENNNVAFSGKGTIRLFRGNKCIDIIGAMENGGDIHNITIKPMEGAESTSFGDDNGFSTTTGDDYSTDEEEKNYTLSTNRCLLVRKPFVTSGAIAVENNIGDFKTLGNDYDRIANEWAGLQVPDGPSGNDFKYTCEGFKEVGSFDYNNYYKEYNTIDNDTYLDSYDHDDATKEYTIPIDNLAQYSCLNIRFQLKDNDKVVTEQPVQVPIIVKDSKTTADAIFNAIIKNEQTKEPIYDKSIERCKTCNVVVLSEATLTKAADDTANDASQVHNIKIYPGGQLVVPSETSYNVNSLAFRRQEDEVSMANIQGKLNVAQEEGVYLDVRIDPSNWHYMTLPYDCRVGDITFADGTPAVVNTDYLLGWYDGAYRAEHKTGGWTYITDNDYILKKGLGYIVALPGDGQVRREIRFPMANDVIAQDLESKTVSGLYAYGGDKTDAELRPNHKGWNMIGNPYLYTYTTDIVKEPLQMGTLEHSPVDPWDGTWVRTGVARYIVEPINNGWSGYSQTTISDLKPFTSYFIQVGGVLENGEYTTVTPETEQQIVFAANSVARNASAPRKVAEAEVMDNHPVWYGVEMIAPNNEKDNTTLLISDEFTDGYDMMDDLVKMRGDYYQYYNFPVLASRNNEGEMAFNALPDSSAAKIGVLLSYYAATAGTYTIATDGRFDLEEVKAAMLYDATTAQYTNLLTENYSFTTNKGNNTNRFTLFVTVERKKVPNITTGMDNLLANGQLSLIAVERTLVLSGLTENADIYVYDMSGKMVTGTHSAGENGIWRTTVPATGVYFVRVNSANSQQTLRTIVK